MRGNYKGENKILYQDDKIVKFIAESKKCGDKEIIIDSEDWNKIKQYRWHPHLGKQGHYYIHANCRENDKAKIISLHRIIMGCSNNKENIIDHINHDNFDNRKENLRLCSNTENCRNQKLSKVNTSGYKGVSWHKGTKKWMSRIKVNQKGIYLGLFDSLDKAAIAYNIAALKYFGEFAQLNNIMAARHGSR